MTTINFKRGDTLSLAGTYKVEGVASSVSAMTIRSQVRQFSGDLVQDLTVVKSAGVGTFSLSATAAQTAAWPLTTLKCDIEFSLSGVVQSTETFSIAVQEDVTQ
jgi:hypothetical protein